MTATPYRCQERRLLACMILWMMASPGECLRCVRCLPRGCDKDGCNTMGWPYCADFRPGLAEFMYECQEPSCREETLNNMTNGSSEPFGNVLRACGEDGDIAGSCRKLPCGDGCVDYRCSCSTDQCNVGLLPPGGGLPASRGRRTSWWYLMAVPASLAVLLAVACVVRARRGRGRAARSLTA